MSTVSTQPEPLRLPTGHVALLFTDVSGSTRGWETYGEAYGSSLRRHFDVISHAVADQGGAVFKTVGDQVCAVFPSALSAVHAAITAQRNISAEPWLEPVGSIQVRMAVHTGDPLYRDGDYFGPPTNRVARLLNAAHPGQILLSNAARTEISPSEKRIGVRPLGVHMLKDLLNPEAIFQVIADGLPAEFPPPRTLDARPHNLPAQLTSFVGRTREMAELADVLAKPSVRLVTLIGPPGVGKTRLAMQFAAEYAYRYPDGVWLVELGAIRDPAGVAHQIESAMGLKSVDGRNATDRLFDALAERQLLLVCDNFEHLLPAADLIAGLLRTTRNVQVLVTSRSLLRVNGESVLEVPPLQTPDPGSEVTLRELGGCPATALFVERGGAARPSWTPSEAEAGDLAYICRELDGLPLAIELAAARLRSMSVREIRSRLSDRFRLLSSGNVDIPERQRTLKAALDWSFDLMSRVERTTLVQLSIFRGGFSMDAAEAVCDAGDVWDVLPSLHDQSFLVARERGGAMRYDMLEVVREYAAERLDESACARRAAHASFYLALAEASVSVLDTLDDAAACERLEADVDNIRAATAWMCSTFNADGCARFAVAMAEFFNRRGWWVERLEALENALALARTALDDKPITAWLHYHLSNAMADVGRMDEAQTSAHESLRRARALHDSRLEAWSLILLGFLAEKRDERETAARLYSEAEDVARGRGDAFTMASALTNQARLADLAGQTDRAVALLQQSLSLWRSVGSARGLATALTNLGCIADEVEGTRAEADGDPALALRKREEAIGLFGEALGLQLRLKNVPKIALLLNNIGEALERAGIPEPAIRLYVAAETLFRRTGSPKAEYVHRQTERARGAIGPERTTALILQAESRDSLEIAADTARLAADGPNGLIRGMIRTSESN